MSQELDKRELWKVKIDDDPDILWLVCDAFNEVHKAFPDTEVMKAKYVRDVEVAGLEDLVVVEEARVLAATGDGIAALERLNTLLKQSSPDV